MRRKIEELPASPTQLVPSETVKKHTRYNETGKQA
jgi:hypothetical protein